MITEVSPILSLLFAKGLGTKTLSKLVDRIAQEDVPLEEIVCLTPDVLAERFGLRPAVAKAIGDAHDRAERTAEELDRHGVQILVRGIAPYPTHLVDVLRDDAPPVLFARGDLSTLMKKAVGFCGARSASKKGIGVAAKSAIQLAGQDVNIVSGYAKGVDLAAHRAAMEAGGVTTIVLAEGILHFRAKREVTALLEDHNHVVVSEFSPKLPWSGRNAMQRNKTICGLSDAVVCIESGTRGGTFAAAETTLSLNLPLFVADYAQPAESAAGNRHFIDRGATPLRGDRTGTPNLRRLYEAIGISTSSESTEPVEPASESTDGAAATDTRPKEPMSEPKPQSAEDSGGRYPKRLIEVDLPIARISAHARREKSIRHGHISTLHIWWARRPLAACRAVICAALWPDPADELCPEAFRAAAVQQIKAFARRVFPEKITEEGRLLSSEKHCSPESRARWEALAAGTLTLDADEPADMPILRLCLLDFIADFANWDNSTVPAYLETSRALTQAAHEALGGVPGTRPLVVDPFAGGGSIPLESLRVGADAFASDLNPVAVLLNKVVLEYIPKYGQRLADEVRKCGEWVKEQAEQELAEFYPKDPDGATPIAYLWARTIKCEGPGCGMEIPLIRSTALSKRKPIAHVKVVVDGNEIKLLLEAGPETTSSATIRGGKATCPKCGYTTPEKRVKAQTTAANGGADTSRLFAVLLQGAEGRRFREPNASDVEAVKRSNARIQRLEHESPELFPVEEINPIRPYKNTVGVCIVTRLGIKRFRDLYTSRQLCSLFSFRNAIERLETGQFGDDTQLADVVKTLLHITLDRIVNANSSLSRWNVTGSKIEGLFSKQALQVIWDFAESNPTGPAMANWHGALEWVSKVLEANIVLEHPGTAERADARLCPLPHNACDLFLTDPPYFAAIAYADLSDAFYVWLRRSLQRVHPALFESDLVEKSHELIVTNSAKSPDGTVKDAEYFAGGMAKALESGREVAKPSALGCVVFADSTTSSWESILSAVIEGGWVLTSSWPIDTELQNRTRASSSASLQSSVFMVCRPRENPDGSLRQDSGEWREVLSELPNRIHEWMPRLAAEGVVGADAIFACLGPALEVFSRYSRVEKANGEEATLREYLEHVWGAVSTEALRMIFDEADAAGLEPDARLTAMWLWTLGAGTGKAGGNGNGEQVFASPLAEDEDVAEEVGKAVQSTGYTLEFDAARKIAQGLGVHLEKIESVVEVKGGKARLLPVAERTKYLFGKDSAAPATTRRKKKSKQKSLFAELDEIEAAESSATGELAGASPGSTALDRVHQAMILFGAGRGEAMKRFLVEEGVGADVRFWKLAQSLSALYPRGTDEKRWVDGVLARKKGLGL